jgi:hypothetical protein
MIAGQVRLSLASTIVSSLIASQGGEGAYGQERVEDGVEEDLLDRHPQQSSRG